MHPHEHSMLNGRAAGDTYSPPAAGDIPDGDVRTPPSRLAPADSLPLPYRIPDLALAALPEGGDLRPVERLTIQDLKGPGAAFTADLDMALSFYALAYKPPGEYETQYHILTGDLLKDRRVMRLAGRTTFVPSLAWSSLEVVLLPVKGTTPGQRLIADLATLQKMFPKYKAYKMWDEVKRRHVVSWESLTLEEGDYIAKVTWPTRDDILEALEPIAFDDLHRLRSANDDVRTLLSARPVE
jgi:hypothetical protein